MSNFSALILAQLDDSKLQKDLQRIQKQPLTFDNVKISNVKFDKSSIDALQAQLDSLTANVSIKLTGGNGGNGGGLGKQIANAINSEINSSTLQPAQTALNNLQNSLLTKHGMKNSAVSSIMQSISDSARNANVQITKVSESFQSVGKNAGQLQSFKISGIDELGNAVTIIDTFDKKTGQLKSSVTNVSRTFAELSAQSESAMKEEEKRVAKLRSTIEQIGKINSKLTLVNPNDINQIAKLETELNAATQKAFDLYSQLGSNVGNATGLAQISDTLEITFNELGTNVRKQLDNVGKSFDSLSNKPQRVATDIKTLYDALSTLASPTADFITKLDAVSTLQGTFSNVRTEVQNLAQAEAAAAKSAKEAAKSAKEAADALALKDQKDAFTRKIKAEINNLIPSTQKFKTELEDIKSKIATADKSQLGHLKAEFDKVLESVRKEEKAVQDAAKAQQTLSKSSTLSNNIQAWMNNNKKAAERFGQELIELQQKLNGNTDASSLQKITLRFREIQSEAKAAGLITNTFATSLKEVGLQALGLTSAAMALQKVIGICKTGLDTVIGLDDALVDLKKTTTMTATELTDFYKEANTVAKQYGATTQEIIQSAADWSRLG